MKSSLESPDWRSYINTLELPNSPQSISTTGSLERFDVVPWLLAWLLAFYTTVRPYLQKTLFDSVMKTLLASLLVLAAVTTGSNSASLRHANLKVTKNVLPLKTFPTLQKREGHSVQKRDGAALAPLQYIEKGYMFVTDITVGAKTFPVLVNTRSADTWIADSDVSCIDFQTGKPRCKFGPLFDPSVSKTFEVVQGQVYNLTYRGGETLTGEVGLDTITVAGISVPKMGFGVVDSAYYLADGVTSGALGLAYKSVTSMCDEKSVASGHPESIPYNPLLINMFEGLGVPPVFSLSLKHKGGVLAIGGIPDFAQHATFYDAPLVNVSVDSSGKKTFWQYQIKIDGYAVYKSTDDVDPANIPLVSRGAINSVVMGTALVYAPNDVVELVASSFDPPGVWEADIGSWTADCKAKPPAFGVSIQGKVFYVKPENMLVPVDGGCMIGVRPDNGDSNLGSNWMMEVLTVFDIGNEKLSFATVDK